jgi:hypothetical protein
VDDDHLLLLGRVDLAADPDLPDLFQRDASGRAKAAWDVFVILLPLGLLLRATRRLGWRNRQLIIACEAAIPRPRDGCGSRGLDELATLVESA